MSGCSASEVYQMGACFVSYTSSVQPDFGDDYLAYESHVDLGNELRVAWTTYRGSDPDGRDGYISVMLQGATTGWMAIGLRRSEEGHAMTDNDVWFARVVDGHAEAIDSWTTTIYPDFDYEMGGTSDLYDVAGEEVDGITSVRFKRLLSTADPWDNPISSAESAFCAPK